MRFRLVADDRLYAGDGFFTVTGDNTAITMVSTAINISIIDPATIDNAISAVGRMIIGSPVGFPYESVLPSWFANLPLKSDYEEAATILKTLLVMVNA